MNKLVEKRMMMGNPADDKLSLFRQQVAFPTLSKLLFSRFTSSSGFLLRRRRSSSARRRRQRSSCRRLARSARVSRLKRKRSDSRRESGKERKCSRATRCDRELNCKIRVLSTQRAQSLFFVFFSSNATSTDCEARAPTTRNGAK